MAQLDPKTQEKITEAINKLADFMNLEFQVEFREEKTEGGALFVSIYTSENAKFLIGKNGQALKSLEHILRLMIAKEQTAQGLLLDINDYRKSRANYLIDLAKQAVNRVRSTQKAEALVPMSSYERRVVHMELASCPDITTESIGEEPSRRVVIKPLSASI